MGGLPTDAVSVKLAVVMPVGPGSQEAARCLDTARGLARWESQTRWIVLVDDEPSERGLGPDVERATGVPVTVLRHPLRRGRGSASPPERIAAAVLYALAWVAKRTDADLVVKLDTDAMVVAPFASRLAGDVAANPVAGLAGSFTVTCNGEPRDFGPWVAPVKRVHDRRLVVGRRRRARSAIRHARGHGYVWGEHALACAIAMPRHAIDAMAAQGFLDDPTLFLGTGLGDDPALGILVRAAGLEQMDHTAAGETLAVAWRGLPGSPDELIGRGYAIIHSVKNDETLSEPAIRAMLAAREPRPPSGT